ncbi:hypothetical protein P691DRAFT_756852 [Macrolepiota fuliginosa MF-IS2]|uniref:Uncharacterized protein n=1 Tax=Macrolepiota fuliginosa MF-IS2 TaxID=1400762 RepID=A0A9P6C4M1_9AGAR|nr:hypothetical protein P691DRAFT_756852 [Macrolepiota fuliginosa MF-IS2]
MTDPRKAAFAVLTAVVLFGTAYSVVYGTYLDTSNPLFSGLPHPLGHSHYFASKSNFINVYFIKKAWGWTSLLFFLSWITSPPRVRTGHRAIKWAVATSVWVIFTMWFFGPSLLDRAIVASGGACVLRGPSGTFVDLPVEVCYSGTIVRPSSHPHFFAAINDVVPVPMDWQDLPRLRRGHDISGHIFLLTMSTLFLADQLRPSLCAPNWTPGHRLAIVGNILLIGIWLFASCTTSVYFHSPLEKITGFLLGVGGFWLTQLGFWGQLTATNTIAERVHPN